MLGGILTGLMGDWEPQPLEAPSPAAGGTRTVKGVGKSLAHSQLGVSPGGLPRGQGVHGLNLGGGGGFGWRKWGCPARWWRTQEESRRAESCRNHSLTGTGMGGSRWQSCGRQHQLCWGSHWWVLSWTRCSKTWTSMGTAPWTLTVSVLPDQAPSLWVPG